MCYCLLILYKYIFCKGWPKKNIFAQLWHSTDVLGSKIKCLLLFSGLAFSWFITDLVQENSMSRSTHVICSCSLIEKKSACIIGNWKGTIILVHYELFSIVLRNEGPHFLKLLSMPKFSYLLKDAWSISRSTSLWWSRWWSTWTTTGEKVKGQKQNNIYDSRLLTT